MDDKRSARLGEIRKAIAANEFFLEYLPTVVLKDGRCAGAEALIRWRHDGRIIPPMEFIPFVENTPLAGLLTYWVIEQVGRDVGSWLRHQTSSVHMGINVPPELLGRGGIEYAELKSKLRGLSHKLILEVSERGVIARLGLQDLNERVGHGSLIALDDVQLREVSSMLLARVKVDIIKLDKAVTDTLTDDPASEPARTVKALASVPGLAIIAEGVETKEQALLLAQLGVEYAQGFYFSRPVSADAFKAYFAAHNHE